MIFHHRPRSPVTWVLLLVGLGIATSLTVALLMGAFTETCASPGDGPPVTPSAEQLAGWPTFEAELLEDAAQWQPEIEGPEVGVAGIPEDFEERPWLDIAEPEPYVEPPVGGIAGLPEVKC